MSSEKPLRGYLLESWLEFREALEGHPELKRLLFDPVTGLPTTPLLFPRFETLLTERDEVSLLCLNVVKYSRIEEMYGWKAFDEVMRQAALALEGITGTDLRDSDVIAELMISGNSFVIVLSPPRNAPKIDPKDLDVIARRVESRVREEIASAIDSPLSRTFECYVGSTTIEYDPGVRLERLVHEGLERALTDSLEREAADAAARGDRLREIIETERIRTLVQPVLRLDDMSVIGYEALSRGPENTEFERPDKLFRVAYDTDSVLRLERLCRKKALEAARDLPEGRVLFMNIEPEAVGDPELRYITFTTLLADLAISPERVVLELTERTAIEDFPSFRSMLRYLRALGFKVAVDDAGAGYGSLQCLEEVSPDWIKVDMSLVRGIDVDDMRQKLVESLLTFATRNNAKLVAEGIETSSELATLRRLGVEYGQGYLFSKPVAPFPPDTALSSSVDG